MLLKGLTVYLLKLKSSKEHIAAWVHIEFAFCDVFGTGQISILLCVNIPNRVSDGG